KKPLYRVRFSMAEIWGDGAEHPEDTLDAEIYEHWIEAAHAA
ncbi:MAG: nitrile hydratase subunit beta, partial [Litoreibacter sp.]|nr:nitrile hydratase subunit beta [Litoreibacter sp.]